MSGSRLSGAAPLSEILAQHAKPYVRPLTYDATFWTRAETRPVGGPHWELTVRDANGRLAASTRGRWKWLAMARAKRSIAEHEGRRRSKHRREHGTFESVKEQL